MNRVRRVMIAAVFAAIMTFCAACTATDSTASDDVEEAATPASATVERRDITDAIALSGTVQAGQSYTISAPEDGALATADDGTLSFVSADGTTAIETPVTATSVEPLVPVGAAVPVNTPIVRVTDAAMLVTAEVTPEQVLRLGDRMAMGTRAQIEGSSGPFDCDLVDSRVTASDDGTYHELCRIPADVPVVVGASAKMVIVLETHDDVLALPIEAVAGTIDHGSVYPEDGGDPVDIGLGITDGIYVEVTSGLEEGDRVLIPSPDIVG